MELETSTSLAEAKIEEPSNGNDLPPVLVDSLPYEDDNADAVADQRINRPDEEGESYAPIEKNEFPLPNNGPREVQTPLGKADGKLPSRKEIDAFERNAHRLSADLKDALSWIYKYIARGSGHSSIKMPSSELRNIYVKLESCCSVSIEMEKSFEEHFGSLVRCNH
jgi:hypothetical protein